MQLVISYYMNAATMCEYSKEEFTAGMLKMGVDSIDKLKKKLPDLRAELKNEDKFRDVYNFAYMFSREVGQYGCHDIAIRKGSSAENGNACYLGAWHLEQLCQQREPCNCL